MEEMRTKVCFYDQAEDQKLRFAVIVTRSDGHWVFCKHIGRNTLEIPGGHREPGEDILTTAKRELYEETGAVDFSIEPICAYSVTASWNYDGQETFGMLFYADVKVFEKELHSEIENIVLMEGLPEAWTYPDIQPYLIQEVQRRRTDNEYACRIPSEDEIRKKWDYEIDHQQEKGNWIVWKSEAIEHYRAGQSVPYYGFLNGRIICEATAVLDPEFALGNGKTAEVCAVELCAFRTIKEYRGKGYFSKLMDFMQKDLKERGYTKAVVGVEPKETLNKAIYRHWGFCEHIGFGTETYPDGTIIQVEFLGKQL